VDIAAVLGTVFGIATSLGIGVVQLNYGLHLMFGVPEGVGAQIGLIVLSVAMATMSTLSGVEKGIRRLSELNVLLAIVLLVWIAVTGNTRRVLDGLVMNVGDFISTFPGRIMDTFAWIQPDDWNAAWTLFFWAWWIAWAPFVGLFLARISRGAHPAAIHRGRAGRTIRLHHVVHVRVRQLRARTRDRRQRQVRPVRHGHARARLLRPHLAVPRAPRSSSDWPL
jgi:hypothetical protein